MNSITAYDAVVNSEFKRIYDRGDLKRYLIKNIANPNLLATAKKQLCYGKTIERPSAVCADKSRFLKFNTKAIKYIILDIDRHTFASLKSNESELLRLLTPTWITATDKGCQVCYALKDSLPINRKHQSAKTKELYTVVKNWLIEAFGADIRGSSRHQGIWRNPLNHEHEFSGYEYTLKQILTAFDMNKNREREFKSEHRATVTPLKRAIDSFVNGGRNNALYWACVKQINATPDVTEDDLGEWATRINGQQADPLEFAEAHKTGRSAWRQYHVHGKRLFGGMVDGQTWTHKQWKKQYQKEYMKRTRGWKMTRQENAKKQAYALADRTRSHVRMVIQTFVNLNQTITAVAIAEAAQVNRRTAAKYLKEMKEEGLV